MMFLGSLSGLILCSCPEGHRFPEMCSPLHVLYSSPVKALVGLTMDVRKKIVGGVEL